MPAHGGRIVELALLLRGSAPEVWEQFTREIREYAAAQTAEMVRCPPENLPRAQGMAIAANEIATLLQNAHKTRDQFHGQPATRKPAGSFAG
jgi:hypothetical protein